MGRRVYSRKELAPEVSIAGAAGMGEIRAVVEVSKRFNDLQGSLLAADPGREPAPHEPPFIHMRTLAKQTPTASVRSSLYSVDFFIVSNFENGTIVLCPDERRSRAATLTSSLTDF